MIRQLLCSLSLVVLGLACAQPAPIPSPVVVTEGGHGLLVGASLQITATTQDGEDAGYTFTVADPSVATVNEAGEVTGLSEGETDVVVTGTDTEAEARHPLVVTADSTVTPNPDGPEVPYLELWLSSAHADATSEPYTHFEEDEEVPASCARCHSSAGFLDYIGADGTAPFSVEQGAPTGDLIRCITCHDEAANELSTVIFPSGFRVDGLGGEARCMTCHQGRASTDDVDADILAAGVGDDEVSEDLHFINIHYYPAAATLFAGKARGGYEYPGLVYDTRFRHVDDFNACIECHEPHSLQVRFESCASCHAGVTDRSTARDIRMLASFSRDYDGDGDTGEGIAREIETLSSDLLSAIQQYGNERAQPICYSAAAYPYFFKDNDGDGECGADEANFGNRYLSFTPRVVRATYNFQMATKDPGAFAHNGKYIIQLLHDSLQDLNGGLSVPRDLTNLVRNDVGHFNGASEAARHWDEDETVSASCSRCHSGAPGYEFFVNFGVGLEVPETANGLECATCHTSFEDTFNIREVTETVFPGDLVLQLPGQDNLCSTCHSGRESKKTIDDHIARSPTLRFRNVHYLPGAATSYGTEAKVGYEFDGKEYAGQYDHPGGNRCTTCHDPVQTEHTFDVRDQWDTRCDLCHGDVDEPEEIRLIHLLDYDGDNNTGETLKAEIEGMATRLINAMHTDAGVCYGAGSYPYFFRDNGGNDSAICDPEERVFSNQFTAWTAELLQTAHNFQISQTEPGAWAHNFDYMGQLLFDSIEVIETAPPADLIRP